MGDSGDKSIPNVRSNEVIRDQQQFLSRCIRLGLAMGFTPSAIRSSCSDQSTDMQNDIFKSNHYLDLRSNFKVDLSFLSFDAARQEKDVGVRLFLNFPRVINNVLVDDFESLRPFWTVLAFGG